VRGIIGGATELEERWTAAKSIALWKVRLRLWLWFREDFRGGRRCIRDGFSAAFCWGFYGGFGDAGLLDTGLAQAIKSTATSVSIFA
jgi:hypothetical protein